MLQYHENLNLTLFTVNCIEQTKIKKKRPGMAHFLEQSYRQSSHRGRSVGENETWAFNQCLHLII